MLTVLNTSPDAEGQFLYLLLVSLIYSGHEPDYWSTEVLEEGYRMNNVMHSQHRILLSEPHHVN